jgi:hypothetical protein
VLDLSVPFGGAAYCFGGALPGLVQSTLPNETDQQVRRVQQPLLAVQAAVPRSRRVACQARGRTSVALRSTTW